MNLDLIVKLNLKCKNKNINVLILDLINYKK